MALTPFEAVTTADFQAHCENVLRRDFAGAALVDDSLDWFFVPWLTLEGRPDLQVDWFQGADNLSLVVRQSDPVYRLPLPIRLTFSDGSHRDLSVLIEAQPTTQVEISEAATVSSITLDPDGDWLIDSSSDRLVAGLAAPFPNPFNPSVTLQYLLERPGAVALRLYDARGRRVVTLVDEARPAGLHQLQWDGRDGDGDGVASGVYLVRLDLDGQPVGTRRLTLLR